MVVVQHISHQIMVSHQTFFISQNASNPDVALKNCSISARAASGGQVFIGVTGANGGYAGYATSGTWSPFTGSHDALLDKTISLNVGDIVIDSELVVVKISDSLTKVRPSNVAMQKGVLGVYVSCRDLTAGAPAAFIRKQNKLKIQLNLMLWLKITIIA